MASRATSFLPTHSVGRGTAAEGGGGGAGATLAALTPLHHAAHGPPPPAARGEDLSSYDASRARLEIYFDRTARDAWERLTSDAPVGNVRATVRAGRDTMRATLLSWLPEDMTGRRLLDAGCGTGALAVEAARRGAEVVAIDVAGGLVSVAAERAPAGLRIDWRQGDMLDPALGTFDHVVAMDSLIHYGAGDITAALTTLAARTRGSILFTVAPLTPALKAMHLAGKLFPRGNRSPAIQPVAEARLRNALTAAIPDMPIGRDRRIAAGFYISHAFELARA